MMNAFLMRRRETFCKLIMFSLPEDLLQAVINSARDQRLLNAKTLFE